MGVIRVLLALALSSGLAQATKKSYDGSSVLRTESLNLAQVKALHTLRLSSPNLDFWKHPAPGQRADIMAHKDDLKALRSFLDTAKIGHSVQIADIGRLLHEAEASGPAGMRSGTFGWSDYHDLDAINLFLEETAARHSFVEVENIGQSFHGKDIKVLKIKKAPVGAQNVFIIAGVSGREWIAPAVATYLINELLTQGQDLLDHINIHILPVANPDGYAYTWTDDRLWAKNRAPSTSSSCFGVNLDRNFDSHWMEGAGASDLPCSDSYAGPVAFSELETQSIRDYSLGLNPSPTLFLSLRSYGQTWVYPYAYSPDLPPNWEDLDNLAHDATAALTAVYGSPYEVGSSGNVLGAFRSGCAIDWQYTVAGTQYAYDVFLRDSGTYGYALPKGQIDETALETYEGLRVLLQFVKDNP